MSIIQAKPPGQTVPKIDKRSVENILYTIDVTELLQPGELAVSVEPYEHNKLSLTDFRVKLGKAIDVRIPPSVVTGSLFIDYTVTVLFKTSLDNVRSAVFQLKVHKN